MSCASPGIALALSGKQDDMQLLSHVFNPNVSILKYIPYIANIAIFLHGKYNDISLGYTYVISAAQGLSVW